MVTNLDWFAPMQRESWKPADGSIFLARGEKRQIHLIQFNDEDWAELLGGDVYRFVNVSRFEDFCLIRRGSL